MEPVFFMQWYFLFSERALIWVGSQASTVCPSGKGNVYLKKNVKALVEWSLQGKPEVPGENSMSVLLCLCIIPVADLQENE
jgi:hypothetical protein